MNCWRSLLEAPAEGNHIVQVYEDDDFLVDALSHFVGSGLARGEGVVLVVTPRHWEACLRRLGAHRVAPHDAELRGQLAVINARTALARLMVDGMPDWKTFQDLVGTVINLTRRKYPRVRAFGEMVDLLWQHGERAAALRLEELWNHLIKVQSLTLCCAYRMDPLDGDAVQNVCRQHSHLPAHDYEQLEARLGRASDAVLGTGIARLVRDLAAARRTGDAVVDEGAHADQCRKGAVAPARGTPQKSAACAHGGLNRCRALSRAAILVDNRASIKTESSMMKARFVTSVFLAFALAISIAQAQSYPAKPVRVVIPWPPGGSNDVVGRLVLQKLAQAMGQQFVVDNRAGAAGSIGAELVAKAPPDGYTLMVHSTTHLGNGTLYKNLPYDVIKDFAAVALLSAQPGVLTVHPSLPVKSVREFVALAKSRPGQILYSSSGNGSAPHLSMALFVSMAGINIVHVPYKGGVPQVTALVSGETQSSLATISTVIAHIQSGKLRPLGVSSAKPTKVLPGIPTISESGVPGYEMAPWIGVFAPAGTPKNIVERLNAEVNKALAQPDIVQKLESQALDPWPSTPEEFSARLKTDFDKYAKLIRLSGAKIE